MPACPRCQQRIQAEAAICPYCRAELKGFGHPGVPIYRASGDEPLCSTCAYHADDSCTYAKRPHAMDCTLYSDLRVPPTTAAKPPRSLKFYYWRYQWAIWLIGLLGVSFLIALWQQQRR